MGEHNTLVVADSKYELCLTINDRPEMAALTRAARMAPDDMMFATPAEGGVTDDVTDEAVPADPFAADRVGDTWQHLWSGSRFRGIRLDRIEDARYLPLLTSVIGAVYSCGGIIYGGAVRDLLIGVAPVDVDIIIAQANTMRFMALMRETAAIEIVQTHSSDACPGRRMRVYMEPRYVASSASMIVLDICMPMMFGCPVGGINRLVFALFEIPADYDVNMLYIERISLPAGDLIPVRPYVVRAEDVLVTDPVSTHEYLRMHVRGGVTNYDRESINTGWCIIRTRHRKCSATGEMAPGSRIIKCADILGSLFRRHASVAHACDGLSAHLYLPNTLRAKRLASLQSAGFTDVTDYTCQNVNCRLCSIDRVLAFAKRSLRQLADDNVSVWHKSLEMAVTRAFRPALLRRLEYIMKHTPHELPCDDIAPVCEWVTIVIGIESLALAHMPTRPRMETINPTCIEDIITLRSSIGKGAVGEDCCIGAHISYYIERATIVGHDVIRRHITTCNMLAKGERVSVNMRTPSPDERIS